MRIKPKTFLLATRPSSYPASHSEVKGHFDKVETVQSFSIQFCLFTPLRALECGRGLQHVYGSYIPVILV